MPFCAWTIVAGGVLGEDHQVVGAAVAGDDQLAGEAAAEGGGVLVLEDAVGRDVEVEVVGEALVVGVGLDRGAVLRDLVGPDAVAGV